MSVLRTQLRGVARRPARMLLTGLAVLIASFVVFATVLAYQITERSVLDGLSGTPAATDLVVGGESSTSTQALERVRAVPGVAEAVGRLSVSGSTSADGSGYLNVTADPGAGPLSRVTVTQGSYPRGPREVAVTPRTVERMGLGVGSTTAVRFTEAGPPVTLTVTGVVAVSDDYGFQAYATEGAVAGLFGEAFVERIDLRLAPGADADAVRRAVEAAAGQGVPADRLPGVRTGAQVRLEEAEQAVRDVDAVFAVVGMFIMIAIVAAALVATSTFRIVFAQRMRQLALLRAVGAGRAGLTWALAAEGALTGLVTGVTGVLAALGFGFALPPVLGWFDIRIAAPGVPLGSALAVVVGAVLITVAAVWAPAFSAAKVAPLEALRSASTTAGRRGIGVLRLLAGLLLAAGAGLLAWIVAAGLPEPDAKDYDPSPMLLGIVASGGLAFLALVALGPLLVRPVLWAVGWPLRRLGPVGRLAVGGVGGAPRRAAAVSVVVALGVTLIAGVLVGGASVRTLAEREMAVSAPADFEVTAAPGETLPAGTVERVRARAEVARVTPYRRADAAVGSSEQQLTVTDLDLRALPALGGMDFAAGGVSGAGPGKAVISGYAADSTGLGVGDTLTLTLGGRSAPVRVVGVLRGQAPLGASVVADPSDLDRLGLAGAPLGLLADAAATGEQARTAAQKALAQVTAGGQLGLTVLADQRDQVDAQITMLLGIAIGLVGLTVLIAVVGVGTTTALSVVERIRESGLLRAVGLSRAGLRTMLTVESGLYGVIGATIGLLLGVPYAWLSVQALGVNAPLELPVPELAALFVLLAAFTALAGVLPARRAARISPMAALGSDE